MCGEPSPKRGAVLPPSAPAPSSVVARNVRAIARANLLSKVDEVAKSRLIVASLTSEARVQERQRVLASIRGKPMPSTFPAALTLKERYNNRSTENREGASRKGCPQFFPPVSSVIDRLGW